MGLAHVVLVLVALVLIETNLLDIMAVIARTVEILIATIVVVVVVVEVVLLVVIVVQELAVAILVLVPKTTIPIVAVATLRAQQPHLRHNKFTTHGKPTHGLHLLVHDRPRKP